MLSCSLARSASLLPLFLLPGLLAAQALSRSALLARTSGSAATGMSSRRSILRPGSGPAASESMPLLFQDHYHRTSGRTPASPALFLLRLLSTARDPQ